MSIWISVHDRLPDDELEPVLVKSTSDEFGNEQLLVGWLGMDEDRDTYWIMDLPMEVGRDIEIPNVTHWTPLPEMP